MQGLHLFDCLRANKSTSAWGLEARVPFLDKDFLQLVMNIDAREKMCRATVGGRTGLQMSIVRLSHVHRGRRIVKVLVCNSFLKVLCHKQMNHNVDSYK